MEERKLANKSSRTYYLCQCDCGNNELVSVRSDYMNKITSCKIHKVITEKLGKVNYNSYGNKMKIINYKDRKNIDILFEDYNYITKTTYQRFKEGDIACPFDKTVYEKGYTGIGNYTTDDIAHNYWFSMFKRCFSEGELNKRPTYKDCLICEDWHNYQIFAQWFHENYYEIPNEVMCLDKDILIKGNKIYTPDTCCIVSNRINVLFTKSDSARGDSPIGTSYLERLNKYQVNCQDSNCKKIYLGVYSDETKAFQVYKDFKEKTIKQVAEKNKEYIPLKVYNAMMNYNVEITD